MDIMESTFEHYLNIISPYVYPAVAVFVLFLCAATAWLVYVRKRNENYPPGPVGLPLVGYIPFLGERLHEDFAELAEKYGDICHLMIGQKHVVILSSDEVLRTAFEGTKFSGRGDLPILRELWQNRGILMSENEKWQTLRSFALEHFNTQLATKAIYSEMMYLMAVLKSEKNHSIREVLIPAITNIAMMGTFEKRSPYSSNLIQAYVDNFIRVSDLIHVSSICSFFSPITLLPKYRTQQAELKELFRKKLHCIREFVIADELLDAKPTFVSEFLNRNINKGDNSGEQFYDEDELVMVIDDIWGASTEATVATLQWGIFYMIKYPEIQRKVQAELDSKVEKDGQHFVLNTEKESFPFTVATLQEIERCGSVAPFGVVHANVECTTLENYIIPASSIIVPNIWKIHRDPQLWEKPEVFDPYRFYEGAHTVIRPPFLLPYSVGIRACPFEKFASTQLFTIFANLLHRFTFKVPPNQKLPKEEDYVIKDFFCIVESRF